MSTWNRIRRNKCSRPVRLPCIPGNFRFPGERAQLCLDAKTDTRIAFSQCFNTTQSGSSTINNMNIVFPCLADKSIFLRLRDFETILLKELVTESKTLLKILGTFTVRSNEDGQVGAHSSTDSVSAVSKVSPTIRIFVGSSPVDFDEVSEEQTENKLDQSRYQSSIFQQDCKQFCITQKCYRTKWKSKNVSSNFSVSCVFDLDGTIPKEKLDKYFILNWSLQPAPSQVKWTCDVHDTGNNCPVSLRLRIPSILCTASRNVHALVSMLDNYIETFMKLRSKMHHSSSFK